MGFCGTRFNIIKFRFLFYCQEDVLCLLFYVTVIVVVIVVVVVVAAVFYCCGTNFVPGVNLWSNGTVKLIYIITVMDKKKQSNKQ